MSKIIEEFGGRLNITQFECADMHSGACVRYLGEQVKTPYCAVSGDDDYFFPGSIELCAGFLDKYPEYAIAYGKTIYVYQEEIGGRQKIVRIAQRPHVAIEAQTAVERFSKFMSSKERQGILFSLYRASALRAVYSGSAELRNFADGSIFENELLPLCFTTLIGKAKSLDCLYMACTIRKQGEERTPPVYHRVDNIEQVPSYQCFSKLLTKELMLCDSIDEEKAGSLIRETILPFFKRTKAMVFKSRQDAAKSRGSVLRKVVRKFRPIRSVWTWLRLLGISREPNLVSLVQLAGPFSPYRRQFLALYGLLANEFPVAERSGASGNSNK